MVNNKYVADHEKLGLTWEKMNILIHCLGNVINCIPIYYDIKYLESPGVEARCAPNSDKEVIAGVL